MHNRDPRGRQVLIPGSPKAMPHRWLATLRRARGMEPEWTEALAYRQVERNQDRLFRKPLRYVSGGAPYRNPKRIERLRRNGRLRVELR